MPSDDCPEEGTGLERSPSIFLSSMPNALANFDGSMNKTTKAVLEKIEKSYKERVLSVSEDIVLRTETTVIVDAMVHQQHHFPETFGGFATSSLQQLLSLAKKHNSNRIDFVADRYKPISIK